MLSFRNPINLTKDFEIQPPPPIGFKSKCFQLKLASAFLSISPNNIKAVNPRQKKTIVNQLERSMERNSENLVITELEPHGDKSEGFFYSSDEIGENCLSSKDFKQFSPILDKDQAIVCKETKQLLFFIPRSNHTFDSKWQESLKHCLLDTLGKPSKSCNQNVVYQSRVIPPN